LAVPFVGKDSPSQSSEFAHSEVLIGLTQLAYRYEGLREADCSVLLKEMKRSLMYEPGNPDKRPSAIKFKSWLDSAMGSDDSEGDNEG